MADYQSLDINASLGTLQAIFKLDRTGEWINLGDTHDDSPATLTATTEVVEHMVTRLGTAPVQVMKNGAKPGVEMSTIYDIDLLAKIVQEITKTKTGVFSDGGLAGVDAEHGVLRLHPIKNGADNSEDIYILDAMLTASPNIISGAGGKAKADLSFVGRPRLKPMEQISDSDVTLTLATGGSLVADTELEYKIGGSDNIGYAIPSTEKAVTPTGSTLTVDVKFPVIFGSLLYRIWKSADGGTTQKYKDVPATELTLSSDYLYFTYTDDGSDTFTTATVNTENTAFTYPIIKWGGEPSDITIV